MKTPDFGINFAVQLVTLLSVLAGVGLVMWELELNRSLVRQEMFSEGTISNRESSLSLAGENPAVVLAKACENSEQLTVEDWMILSFVYNETMDTVNRMVLLESGLYPQDAWESNLLVGRFGFIFSTAAGRAWWESFNASPDVQEPVDAFLATLGPPNCTAAYDHWKQRAVEIERQWDL